MQFFFSILHASSRRVSFISFFSTLLRQASREWFSVSRVCLYLCMDRKKKREKNFYHRLYMVCRDIVMEWSYIYMLLCMLSSHFTILIPVIFCNFKNVQKQFYANIWPKHFLNSFPALATKAHENQMNFDEEDFLFLFLLPKNWDKTARLWIQMNIFISFTILLKKLFIFSFMCCRLCALGIEHIKENIYRLAFSWFLVLFNTIELYF